MRPQSLLVAAALAALTACLTAAPEDDASSDEGAIEAVQSLEGAFAQQGGPVHFLFHRGDPGEDDVFVGEIDVAGQAQRSAGKAQVGRDGLGTNLTMTPRAAQAGAKPKDAGASADASPTRAPDGGNTDGGGAAEDGLSVAQQVFSGTVHFLRIGKNDTLLVRVDESGKTSQFKKLASWCGTGGAADCVDGVQRTGLDCKDSPVCTKNKCACP